MTRHHLKTSSYIVFIIWLISLTTVKEAIATTHDLPNIKTSINIYHAEDFSYQPGDTFCIPSDQVIGGLRLIGFKGSIEKPLVFMNCGGRTIIDEPTYAGISFQECNYVKLTGTGDENEEYGIYIRKTKSGSVGVGVGYLSSDVEIEYIEIAHTGFAGIMAKSDPHCDYPAAWRRNGYVLKNLHIHHNYIHDTGGEGMYIGYTGSYLYTSKRSCNSEYIFAHWLENVNIHHNLIENAGWDGIQVNLVRKNARIHHNRIINYGVLFQTYQNFGMSLGSGNIQVYNNYIEHQLPNNGCMGMQMISAQSGSYVTGNVIVNTDSYGIFIHNRHAFDSTFGYYVINNTVVNAGQSSTDPRSAIFYNACITQSEDENVIGTCQENIPSYFKNNLIINPGVDYSESNFWKKEAENYIDFNTRELRDAAIPNMSNNYFAIDATNLWLSDPVNNDYRISSTESPLYQTGEAITDYPGSSYDIDGTERNADGFIDIGAYEYFSALEVTDGCERSPLTLYPNPVTDVLFVTTDSVVTTELAIYNSIGELVRLINYRNKNFPANELQVNVSELPRGVYMLSVDNTTYLFMKN